MSILCHSTHNEYFIAKVKEKTLVNKKFWVGMLVVVLVFGMTIVGCDNPTKNGAGGSGILTVTGILARYSGIYVAISDVGAMDGDGDGPVLWGEKNQTYSTRLNQHNDFVETHISAFRKLYLSYFVKYYDINMLCEMPASLTR